MKEGKGNAQAFHLTGYLLGVRNAAGFEVKGLIDLLVNTVVSGEYRCHLLLLHRGGLHQGKDVAVVAHELTRFRKEVYQGNVHSQENSKAAIKAIVGSRCSGEFAKLRA